MAPRFQMKLGIPADATRLPDSPDTIVAVEPTVGSRARSKGQLYLLVTCMVPGPRAREATRLVAEAIRHEYYYDESAGIRVCLVKAITAANKRLMHARERAVLSELLGEPSAGRSPETGSPGGPVGVAVAVIRDHELYVATVGPAEAYLSRGARLSTLPDPHRERGLPTAELEPEVWRGEIGLGDQLALVSPNLMAHLSPEELKDALVTLHPQPALEQLLRRFVEAGGRGSDGGLIIEVGEAPAVRPSRTLVAVRPPEPLAGQPDRSPIPLADSVSGGMAAAQAGARRARSAAGGAFGRLIFRFQEALPSRSPGPRRVTPLATRREAQRRAAAAILVLVAVVGSLGLGVSLLGNRTSPGQVLASAENGQAALDGARKDLDRVSGPGVDLVANDPTTAEQLLRDALKQLDVAAAAGITASTVEELRARARAGLDRLYGMIDVTPINDFTFPADAKVNLTALVRGPDGVPYVLDSTTATVYRINVAEHKAVAIFRDGTKTRVGTEAAPRLLVTGGPDLVILDVKNVLWRWRPADTTGKGTASKIAVKGSAEWGNDLLAIGTFVRDAKAGLYNLYTIDPSAQEILAYAPAADGSGFPAAPSKRLTTPRPVDGITSLYIDGDIWIADSGRILRVNGGTTEGWAAAALPDGDLRTAPSFVAVMSASDRRAGRIYGYDPGNARLVAFLKATGDYVEEYRIMGGGADWEDVRGWYVEPGIADAPDSVVWITATGVGRALLAPLTVAPDASGTPGPAGSGSVVPSTAP
jgi:hypothetical protein